MNGQMGFGEDEPLETRACLISGVHEPHVWYGALHDYQCPGIARMIDPATHARRDDPEQSKEAARVERDGKVIACLKVHGDFHVRGGLMDDDLGQLAGFPEGHETYRRRGGDLRKERWTVWLRDEKGKTQRGRTMLGGSAGLSVLTPEGIAEYERRWGPLPS